jgi:carotenoid cleavage dioxygenase-like enzyme
LWSSATLLARSKMALSLAGGALRENQAFCAHPKFDADTGRMVAFSLGLRFAEGERDQFRKLSKPRLRAH